MNRTARLLSVIFLGCVCAAHGVTRTWVSSLGGNWGTPANWSDSTLPGADDIADLSAASGTINLTADVTVGEILYNPTFSGTTKVLTILSDTDAPSSRSITLMTTALRRVQVGAGAELRMDADLKPAGNTLKDGQGSLVIKRRLFPVISYIELYIEQGRLVNEGAITFPQIRMFLGTADGDTGAAPEFVMRPGSTYIPTAVSGSDLILGCNRAFAVNSRAVVTHEGGVLDLSTTTGGEMFLNGFWTGGSCVYNLSGGEVTIGSKLMNVSYYGAGTINQSGGKLTAGALNFTSPDPSSGSGTYNLTGGELWLGGVAKKDTGTAAFNIGGARIYPFNAGFGIWGSTRPTLTGINGPTRFCSTGSGYESWIGDLAGPGGLIKEGADALNFSGTHTFTGDIVVSNGTLNVMASMSGRNAVLVAGGSMMALYPGYPVAFSSLTVSDGMLYVPAGNGLVLTANDPWVRVVGTGIVELLAGAGLSGVTGLDVSESGVIDLSEGGQAFVGRLKVDGVQQPYGFYTSANCAAITGSGTLVVGGGVWTDVGNDRLWSTGANWVAGSTPNGPQAAADLSGAVSNAVPVNTLIMDLATVDNNYLVLASGVAGAVLTNTCPAGVTNTLNMSAEGVIYVGAGETLVLDNNLCLMGNLYKRGLGTLVLQRKTFGVAPGATIYFCVEAGKVIGRAPMTDVLMFVGKPERATAGPTPEFILEDVPGASFGGSSFISAINSLATSLNPGNGIFTQNGGVVMPATTWGEGAIIGLVAGEASLGGTGTYNLVNGTLQMSKLLQLSLDNGRGILRQSGGLADLTTFAVARGEVYLTGGLMALNAFDNKAAAQCTFYMGGGRLEPKTESTLTLQSPAVFTGDNGPMTFAPATGRAITLSGALSGSGGFIKDDAGTLTLAGDGTFAGAVVVNSGTLAVSGSLAGTNDMTLLDGTLDVFPNGGAKLGDLAITNGVLNIGSSVIVTAEKLFIEGVEWAAGLYASTNCAKITGSGLLIVGAEPGQWTNAGDDDNWSTPDNWVAGIIPNTAYSVANLSGAVSNATPFRTLVMDLVAVTNQQVIFDAGVAGAVLTNTSPAGVTNTLYLAAEGVIVVGEGQTLVLDHDLCTLGRVYKRGPGTLVLKQHTYAHSSLVSAGSSPYVIVDDGKVINAGPMSDVMISVGKLSSEVPGATPEFILADAPAASVGGVSFITVLNALATTPGPGIFTQNGGTVTPAISWGDQIALAHTSAMVGTPGTGTYNLVKGTLTVAHILTLGKNGGDAYGHFGIFNQSGGLADVGQLDGKMGEINLTGGLFKAGDIDIKYTSDVTFHLGGGRLEPKTAAWVVIRAPVVLTGINGDMTFALAAGQSMQLADTAPASGSGGFVKEGAGLLWLSNINTFTGTARIKAGTCTLAATCSFTESTNIVIDAGAVLDIQRNGAALNSNLWLRVATDGKVQLDFEGEVEVGHLVLNGYECPGQGRRYGASSSTSPLDIIKDDFFTGTGVLKVVGAHGADGTLLLVR